MARCNHIIKYDNGEEERCKREAEKKMVVCWQHSKDRINNENFSKYIRKIKEKLSV